MKSNSCNRSYLVFINMLMLLLIAGCTASLAPWLDYVTISGHVWIDVNIDGIQNSGENGRSGVTIELSTSTDNLVATTTTDADGNYTFFDLEPGNYYVTFTPPAGGIFSPQDQGNDDTIDSDANLVGGQTDVISLSPGEANISVDAGIWWAVGPLEEEEEAEEAAEAEAAEAEAAEAAEAAEEEEEEGEEEEEEGASIPLPGTYLYEAQIGSASCIGGGPVASPAAPVELTVADHGNAFWIVFPSITLEFHRTGPTSFATAPMQDTIDTHGGNPATLSAELIWELSLISAEELVGTLTVETSEPCTITHFIELERED
jgi:hypothetical protein